MLFLAVKKRDSRAVRNTALSSTCQHLTNSTTTIAMIACVNNGCRYRRVPRSSSTGRKVLVMDPEPHLSSPPEPRREIPFPSPADVPKSIAVFLQKGYIDSHGSPHAPEQFTRGKEGLEAHGYSEWASGSLMKELGVGAFGGVRLVYKLQDRHLPAKQRRFAALKAQHMAQWTIRRTWNEIMVMRAVKHKHIIDFYSAFVVLPPTGKWKLSQIASASSDVSADAPYNYTGLLPSSEAFCPSPQSDEVWILMQFADAGDMTKEITRYPDWYIPEEGCRYYMHQICSALKYMHSKSIKHCDLHTGNIFLHYMPDGITKSCLLGDFGSSIIMPLDPDENDSFVKDVGQAIKVLKLMLIGIAPTARSTPHVSQSAHHVLNPLVPPLNVDVLLAFAWFTDGPSTAPVPDRPRTPLTLPVSPLKADSGAGAEQSSSRTRRSTDVPESSRRRTSQESGSTDPSTTGSRVRQRSPSPTSSPSSSRAHKKRRDD